MSDDTYVAVDEVAERLGLPLGVLVRRVQAGDVPARRIDGPDGPRYELRLSDLGIEPDYAFEPVANTPYVDPRGDGAEFEIELSGGVATGDDASRDVQDAWEVPDLPEIASAAPAAHAQTADQPRPADDLTSAVPPPRVAESGVAVVDYSQAGPLAEIAAMSIDPRELVAGLLDRWERTLEQRIYAEQRQRFETELSARQNLVKELQLELKSAHAEHSAAQAENARILAERERQLRDREQELAQTHAELVRVSKRKRSWFFGR